MISSSSSSSSLDDDARRETFWIEESGRYHPFSRTSSFVVVAAPFVVVETLVGVGVVCIDIIKAVVVENILSFFLFFFPSHQ